MHAPVDRGQLADGCELAGLEQLLVEAVGFGAELTTKASTISLGKFRIGPNCKVFTPEGKEVEPGSGEKLVSAFRVMEKFTEYWGVGLYTPLGYKLYPSYVDEMYFEVFPSVNDAITALEAGEIDYIVCATMTPDHYFPLLYTAGAVGQDDPVSFPIVGFDSSISMRAASSRAMN